MKKKLNLTKNLFLSMVLAGCLVLLAGCTSLSYVGDDYDAKKSSSIQTSELFTFSTYAKTLEEDNIDMKLGVAKTPLPDALVVYINIKNNSTAADYVFYMKDLVIKAGNETLKPLTPSAYLNAYQSYETGTYNGLSNIAPTLGAFADIQNAYQNVNNMVNTASARSNADTAATSQIGTIAKGISSHTITSAGVIKAGSSDYFYVFLKDPDFLPLDITYKDLTYSFGNSKDAKEAK